MRHPLQVLGFLAWLLCLGYGTSVLAQVPAADTKPEANKPEAGKFIRVQRADDQPTKLETAIGATCPPPERCPDGRPRQRRPRGRPGLLRQAQPATGAVRRRPLRAGRLPGTRIPKGGRTKSDNPLALIQQAMKFVLDLDSQTECIDYTRKNFVHADLSPEALAEGIRQRGDDALTLTLGIAADLLRQQNMQERQRQNNPRKKDAELDFSTLLLDPEAPIKLKRFMAEQMESLGSAEGGLGQTLNTILIADRNQAALKVFQKELAKGKKKIAIFYGAGHMPDMEKRLRGLRAQAAERTVVDGRGTFRSRRRGLGICWRC